MKEAAQQPETAHSPGDIYQQQSCEHITTACSVTVQCYRKEAAQQPETTNSPVDIYQQ